MRPTLLPLAARVSLGLFLATAVNAQTRLTPSDTIVYVGTYTGPNSQGIYAFRLTARDGEPALEPLGLAAAMTQPSFLELDPGRGLLFAISEVGKYQDQPTGSVASFRIDRTTGRLTRINEVTSGAAGPCHLLLDRTGTNLLIANYSGGAVACLPVHPDGRLGEPTSVVTHSGRSVHPQRQTAPHAHAVTLDPAQRFLFVCDLGLDQVKAYRFDAHRHTLAPHQPPPAGLKPGAGPRHMAFRPDGRFAYVVNELDSTVTVFRYEAAIGQLTAIESVSTLPAGFAGASTTAEILVHPSGGFVYASNRGHDSLAIFAVEPDRGSIRLVGHQPTGGKTPRHFGLDPSGTILAMANQNSDTIVLTRVDPATGLLRPSPQIASAPSPVCVVFLPPAKRN